MKKHPKKYSDILQSIDDYAKGLGDKKVLIMAHDEFLWFHEKRFGETPKANEFVLKLSGGDVIIRSNLTTLNRSV